MGFRCQAISAIASTSTAAPSGRVATPMAERACLPRSPSTSIRKSEQPLMTLCGSVKSGAQLTKPVSLTMRLTFSRSPSAALRLARMLMAQMRAAFWPSSTPYSRPSLPMNLSPPGQNRNLAGDEQQFADRHGRDVAGGGRGRHGQRDAQRLQSGFGIFWPLLFPFGCPDVAALVAQNPGRRKGVE